MRDCEVGVTQSIVAEIPGPSLKTQDSNSSWKRGKAALPVETAVQSALVPVCLNASMRNY